MKERFLAFAAIMTFALGAHAGSTGSSQLHTPQGSGAANANGDYVSCVACLNTTYRYFIEVTPGLTRLDVDIFDADIGLGGATEATAGRDRDRGGYDTTVEYTMWNPAGQQRPTNFTTGSTTLPAGGDNAWLTLISFTGDYVRDNFGTVAYNNNDGTVNWATNWTETNDNGAAGSGLIQINGAQLRIQDDGNANPSTITREANLTGWTGATFTFDFSSANVNAGRSIFVQVSGDGGGSWTTLDTFTGTVAAGSRTFNIGSFVASNTRVRFITGANGYTGNDTFFVDNLQIKNSTVNSGHWEIRVDQSSAITGGDDINAIGIRAHDGTSGSGGTELNVYADSMIEIGQNPPASGTSARAYTLYPYVTSGCTCGHNDFDYDSNRGSVGSVSYASRTSAFSQNLTSATLSGDNVWNRDTVTGWTSDFLSTDYGIWTLAASISSYVVAGTPNGNYTTYYPSNYNIGANPPTANPQTNAFRTYLPTDAGAAPVKPYLEQLLTRRTPFDEPHPVGASRPYTVTVRLENPTSHPITFSASNLVTANVPGAGAVYGGNAQVSQGTIVSQPSLGGTGDVTWNPGTVAAGATVLLSYDVSVTPSSAGQRIPVTATPASGNGTRAQFVDETGNSTQTRARMLLGPVCELAVTQGLVTPVVVSSFDAAVRGGATLVEWTTSSEAGTIAFRLFRFDPSTGELVPASRSVVPAIGARGGRYRVVDSGNSDPSASYVLEELTAAGNATRHGPFRLNGASSAEPIPADEFELEPRRGPKRPTSVALAGDKLHPVAVIAGIRETGVVQVSAGEIAALLATSVAKVTQAIASGKVSVTSNGATVAWLPSPDGASVRFFGEASTSHYSIERAYRIELARGTKMAAIDASAPSSATTSFTAKLPVEVDAFAATVLPLDPEGDYWFWKSLVPGVAGYSTVSFELPAPALASDSGASLEVRLQGALADVTHGAKIRLNGVPIGEITWPSLDAKSASLAIPAATLRAGANSVEVEGIVPPGKSWDAFYVDGFTLTYVRSSMPDDGLLEMPSSPGTGVTAGPFASAPVVLDVTNRNTPRLIRGGSTGPSGISLVVPAGAKALYFAAEGSIKTPASLRAAEASWLSSYANAGDYVIIAPSQLREPAEALGRLRQRDGLVPLVVDLDQIYDEFAGGNRTPHAIRNFLKSATTRWRRAPKYVVLAGAGTLDYRGIETGPGLVPPLMIKTRDGLFAADSQFVDANGDTLPDLALGRIPVWSAEELDAYVDKLEARKAAAPKALVFSADKVDRGTDFRAYSAGIESAIRASNPARIHLDELTAPIARSMFMSTWNAGASLVSWIGHGGLDRLASSSLITTADVPSLTVTGGAYPVFLAATCTINRFEVGDIESLGAAMTRAPGAGAVAVWSASGVSINAEAVELERRLAHLARQKPGSRIGDLAVKALAGSPARSETAALYQLMGDPALTIDLPEETSAPGTPGAPLE